VDLHVVAGREGDALLLGQRLAVADDLGPDLVVVFLAALQLGRAEVPALVAAGDRHVIDVQRRPPRQLDGDARPRPRLLVLVLRLLLLAALPGRLAARLWLGRDGGVAGRRRVDQRPRAGAEAVKAAVAEAAVAGPVAAVGKAPAAGDVQGAAV